MNRTLLRLALVPGLLLLAGCGGGAPAVPADAPLVRIEIPATGYYRLSYEDLESAGVSPGGYQPGYMTLATQGQPAALTVVNAAPGTFGPGDYVEFFGQGLDNQFTGTAVYWLGPGVDVRPMGSRSAAPVPGLAPLAACRQTLHCEQNLVAWGVTPGAPDQDYYFWAKLTAPQAASFAFQLPGLDEQAGDSALTVCLQGGTSGGPAPDHHVQVAVNGAQVGDARWNNATVDIQTFSLPPGLLQAGANRVTLTLPGDTGALAEVCYLNYFEVSHGTPILAVDGAAAYQFTGTPEPPVLEVDTAAAFQIAGGTGRPIQIQGLAGPSVELLDITNPLLPVRLTGVAVAPLGGAYAATFQDPSSSTRAYYAQDLETVRKPSAWAPWVNGRLHAPQGADYLLITPRAFLPAAAPLVQLRTSQGLRAKAVAVEDIYNEFAFGIPDPQAIKDFLAYAATAWAAPAPSSVLLLGDADWDYRDRQNTGKVSQVPCHLTFTGGDFGLTPDDNWYVALDGKDLVPSMMIGRLPSATPEQAATLVQKLITYETATGAPPQAALFVADNNDTSFNANCDALAALLPADIAATKVYLSNFTDFNLCSQDIVAALNAGMLLGLYSGHGDIYVWAGEMVLDAGKLPQLANSGAPTFLVSLDCLNGWDALDNGYCLAESFVAWPAGGAIGAYSSSGLGLESDLQLVSTRLMHLMFAGGGPTLGQLCTQAKVQAYQAGASSDVLITLTLIGDPATHLRGLP